MTEKIWIAIIGGVSAIVVAGINCYAVSIKSENEQKRRGCSV